MSFLGLELLLWILLIESCLISPILGRMETTSLRRAVARGELIARSRIYRKTMVFQWAWTCVVLAAWLKMGRSLGEVGLVVRAAGWDWVGLGIGLTAAGLLGWQLRRASADREKLQKLRGELGSLEHFVPHTRAELVQFRVLSITAGICEEIRYRGVLMVGLIAVIGLWPAVFLSSVIFGIGHSYQGSIGVLKTGAVGLLAALAVVFSGSLFLAILFHMVLDLVQGDLLYEIVNQDAIRPLEAGAILEAAR